VNSKKAKQLRKMTAIKLEENGTKFLTRKQYRASNKYAKDKALYKAYRTMEKNAKRNYAQTNTYVRERLGEEWRGELE